MNKLKSSKELIAEIRKMPGIYIREHSITNLAMFILGYECAAADDFQHQTTMFTNWLKNRHHVHMAVIWDGVLLKIAGNEKDALELFWKEWDLFLADLTNGVETKRKFIWDDDD